MYCRHCGKQIHDQAVVCIGCGCPPWNGQAFCQVCGNGSVPGAVACVKCGCRLDTGQGAKSKLAAGLLGVFLGAWGIHRFYLGFIGIGIAQIFVTLCTCGIGALWGFIEGILILAGAINRDAQGMPFKD